MDFLELEKGEPLVDIGSYCLMPNHFHLLLHQRQEDGISRFMQKLTTAYTMYFNIKNKRTGVLFQGRFKSKHAAEDRYLKYLLSYIHLNPSNHSAYKYSSYEDFVDTDRPQGRILNKTFLPVYFDSPKKFAAELEEWLGYRKEYQGSTLMD
jgi:putative transposase